MEISQVLVPRIHNLGENNRVTGRSDVGRQNLRWTSEFRGQREDPGVEGSLVVQMFTGFTVSLVPRDELRGPDERERCLRVSGIIKGWPEIVTRV